MSINRDELNNYYNKVNLMVDEYVEKWKVRPSQLKRHFSKLSKFLEKNGIQQIEIGKRVLLDVLEDRCGQEEDGVITFESFKLYESSEYKFSSLKECLYKGIEKANLSMEKEIADYFDTNLGDIDIVDSNKHLFKISDWQGKDLQVIIYSSEDIDLISGNFAEFISDELLSKKIELTGKINIDIRRLVEKDVTQAILEEVKPKTIDLITECLGGDFKYNTGINNFHIWVG